MQWRFAGYGFGYIGDWNVPVLLTSELNRRLQSGLPEKTTKSNWLEHKFSEDNGKIQNHHIYNRKKNEFRTIFILNDGMSSDW